MISVIHPDNTRSLRVAHKLGERLEGETDLDGCRSLVYGVTR